METERGGKFVIGPGPDESKGLVSFSPHKAPHTEITEREREGEGAS